MFAPLKALVSRIWPARTNGLQSAAQSDQHQGWLAEQIRAYSNPRWYANSDIDNPTGETPEMKRAYRKALKEPAIKAPLLKKIYAVASQPVKVHAADNKDAKSKEAASWIDYCIGKSRGGWPRLVHDCGLHSLLEGFAIASPVRCVVERGKYQGWWGLEAVKFKDTENLKFTIDEYKNITNIRNFVGGDGTQEFDPKDFLHLHIVDRLWHIFYACYAATAKRVASGDMAWHFIFSTKSTAYPHQPPVTLHNSHPLSCWRHSFFDVFALCLKMLYPRHLMRLLRHG